MLLPFDFRKDRYLVLDFSATNPDLVGLDLTSTAIFTDYIFSKLRNAGAKVGLGGYNEHRVIYRRSEHFADSGNGGVEAVPGNGPREIHLGIDFWADAGTPVFAPLNGIIHSFQDNDNFGDYGPTIILEHTSINQPRYSLYGHLSRQSLHGLQEGKEIKAGDQLGTIGPHPENGDWPPHLHFQCMTDLLNLKGDFPGVCSINDRATFLAICPNPNDLLGIAELP